MTEGLKLYDRSHGSVGIPNCLLYPFVLIGTSSSSAQARDVRKRQDQSKDGGHKAKDHNRSGTIDPREFTCI